MNKNFLYVYLGITVLILAGVIFFFQGRSACGTYVSIDVAGLTEAKPPTTVELKTGDTYDLTASIVKKNINGTEFRTLAYNGSIPGPLIKVQQGSAVTINFKNDTDMDTTLHSHGVRLGCTIQASRSSVSF
jgi:FtsP/CotA-like multicopper oxidase with cupredoxin domain